MKQRHHAGISDRTHAGSQGKHQITRAFRFPRTFLAVLAVCFAADLAPTHAEPASLQPLVHPGKWPPVPPNAARAVQGTGNYAYVVLGLGGLAVIDVSHPANPVRVGGYDTSGVARSVAVSGNYAYVADGPAGLQVIDVSDPTHCVRVGGYDTVGEPYGVALSGNFAYVADGSSGLQVIDVSNPTNCVWVGGYDTRGYAAGVAVVAGRIYVADGPEGLVVLPTLPNVQFTVRVNAAPGVPFTLQAAPHLNAPIPWTTLVTTNVPAMPFDYVDFDVKLSEKPQKYYRVRQP